jgi:O-acetylhomoserine/O-acetylserine sulfhydrylase-like pyridoxal-dependent enzyme
VASGQSAQMHALLTFMQAGDNFVSASELYGGTHTQFGHSFKQIGIDAKFADVSDIEQIKSLIDDNTKVRTFDHTCSIAIPVGSDFVFRLSQIFISPTWNK